MVIVTGGALVFQGWRLDPLLLLCQLMTCIVATSFAFETLNLRDERQNQRPPDDPQWNPPPPRIQQEEPQDSYFYDIDDLDLTETSELPSPRSPMKDVLDGEEGWTVVGDFNDEWEEDTQQPQKSTKERTQERTQKDSNLLQAVEDWE